MRQTETHRYVAPQSAEVYNTIETTLLSGCITYILQNDVVDFLPYAFQIMAQILDSAPTNHDMPVALTSMLPILLTATLWEQKGNVPALVRLLQAFLRRGSSLFTSSNIPAILGIAFQRLIPSRIHELLGFEVLLTIFTHIPLDNLQPFVSGIWGHLLNRLQNHRTPSYTSSFSYFVWALSALPLGPDFAIESLETIQKG